MGFPSLVVPMPTFPFERIVAWRASWTADPADARAFARLAGARVAEVVRELTLGGDPRGRRVVVLTRDAGPDDVGASAGAWLRAWGALVQVTEPTEAALAALDADLDLVLDAVGGLTRGESAAALRRMMDVLAPVISIDRPSGVDFDGGVVEPLSVRAVATVALGLVSDELVNPDVSDAVGEVYVVDLGLDERFWAEAGDAEAAFGFCEGSVARVR
jgi:hypothetical protein